MAIFIWGYNLKKGSVTKLKDLKSQVSEILSQPFENLTFKTSIMNIGAETNILRPSLRG